MILYNLYKLNDYSKKKNAEGEFDCDKYNGEIEDICKELEKERGYHLRLGRTDNVILFGGREPRFPSTLLFRSVVGNKFLSYLSEVFKLNST